jgi:hypothetical protein
MTSLSRLFIESCCFFYARKKRKKQLGEEQSLDKQRRVASPKSEKHNASSSSSSGAQSNPNQTVTGSLCTWIHRNFFASTGRFGKFVANHGIERYIGALDIVRHLPIVVEATGTLSGKGASHASEGDVVVACFECPSIAMSRRLLLRGNSNVDQRRPTYS